MSLEIKIMEDLKTAMKAKDNASLRGIRAIKAAILLFKTDGSNNILNEENEIKLLQKLVKQRQDSLAIFTQQNRAELANLEAEEIEVISKYLPKQLSQEELNSTINDIITQLGASSIKDMGKVMAEASSKLAGKADGKSISEIVKSLLSNV
jgi:uncharacterized protein